MEGIVVGVDRSAASTAALEWALAEGIRRGRPVTAVRAWVDPVTAGYPIGTILANSSEQVGKAALESAQEAVKDACAAVPGADAVDVHAVALRGAAGSVLAEASRGADVVVVGTRAAGALSRAVLGSVSSSVLHHAHSPVAVVPEPHTPGTRDPRVVVGVDHSPASRAALLWAAEHAARRKVLLVPVLVREPSWAVEAPLGQLAASLAQLESNEVRALHDAVPNDIDVVVEPEVLAGHAGAALLEIVQPQDVLVVGSRGRGGFAGLLLGSTSTSVAQHAVCPVVVVRESMAG
jgi:nucleotide-binding universal stress UspA family protein